MKQFTREDSSPQAERNWWCTGFIFLCTVPKTNSQSPWKFHKRKFHLNQPLIFRCEVAVRFREGPTCWESSGDFEWNTWRRKFLRHLFCFGIRLPHKKITTAVCSCCAKRQTFQGIWWNFPPQKFSWATDGWAPWVTMYLLIWSLNHPILRIFFCHAEKGLCATKLDHHKQKVAMLHRSTLHGTDISPTKVHFTSATEIRSQWVVLSKVSFHRNVFRWHCEIWGYKNSHVNTLLRWPKRGWNRVSLFVGRFFVG